MARLMFITPSLAHGGAERHTVTLMNRLAERLHECHALHIKSRADLVPNLGEAGTVHDLAAARYLDFAALRRLAHAIGRVGPAAIVTANPYALMYASIALRLARIDAALVVTYHSNRLLGAKEWLQMIAYRPFFWSADAAIFVCERQRRHWMRRGVCSRTNEVIYNGVDTSWYADTWNAEARRAIRAAWGFAEDDYVIGISALLRPEKNHVQLVDAVARLRARGIPARALLVGDGEMRDVIARRSRALGVERDIVFAGVQPDVRPHVVACDAMVLCSFTEAFSLAALEAMSLGRAVVHSDVGGAAEMITHGVNGFLFPVRDTEALVDRLSRLAARDLAEAMGRAARVAVEARFSERVMIDRYEATLRTLCHREPATDTHARDAGDRDSAMTRHSAKDHGASPDSPSGSWGSRNS